MSIHRPMTLLFALLALAALGAAPRTAEAQFGRGEKGEQQCHDANWNGVRIEGQVIYEMHIGTFTPEGTWKAAGQQLKALKDLGVTVLEIMPVHDFCGRYGWGYDGVDFFAPTRLYGPPDDFRAFVDTAHSLGLGVILDVVYNHAGMTDLDCLTQQAAGN